MSMLAGLGRGLQNFSTILGDHEKMNRAEQQRQLDHERQVHLADLTHRRQAALQKDSQDFQGKHRDADRELTQQQITQTGKYQDAQLGIAQGTYDMQVEKHKGEQLFWTADGKPVTRAQLGGMSEEEKGGLITNEQNNLNFQMTVLRETKKLENELDKTKRAEMVAEMEAGGIFEDLPPEAQRMLKMSVSSPQAAKVYEAMLEAQAKTGVKMEHQLDALKQLHAMQPVTKENLTEANRLRAISGLPKLSVGEKALPGFWAMLTGGTEEVLVEEGQGGAAAVKSAAPNPNAEAIGASYVAGKGKGTEGMGSTAARGAGVVGSALKGYVSRNADPESPAVIEREIKATPEYREATKNMAPLAEKNYLANKVQEEIVMREVGPQQPGETEVGYQQRIEEAMKNAGIRYTGARK